MIKTWTEVAREEGRLEERRRQVLRFLEIRFTLLSELVRQRVAAWPADRLEELCDALFAGQSPREVGLED